MVVTQCKCREEPCIIQASQGLHRVIVFDRRVLDIAKIPNVKERDEYRRYLRRDDDWNSGEMSRETVRSLNSMFSSSFRPLEINIPFDTECLQPQSTIYEQYRVALTVQWLGTTKGAGLQRPTSNLRKR